MVKRTHCWLIPAKILLGRNTCYIHVASLEVVEIAPMTDLLFSGFEGCTTEMSLERNLNCVLAWSG